MDRLDGMNVSQRGSFFFFSLFQELYLKEMSECTVQVYRSTRKLKNFKGFESLEKFCVIIRVAFARFVRDLFAKRHETVYSLFIKHVHKGLFNIFPNDWRTISNNIIGLSTLNPLSTFSSHSNSRTRSRSKHSTNAIVWVVFNGALPLFNVCNCRYRADIIRHS